MTKPPSTPYITSPYQLAAYFRPTTARVSRGSTSARLADHIILAERLKDGTVLAGEWIPSDDDGGVIDQW